MSKATGIGIIGCGQMARFHHEGYARAGARIVSVCDLRLDAAAAVAERYGSRAVDDYRAVLDDPEVELVSVLTSAASHRAICLDALAAGKGVVCEKTLSDNPADAAEIARAAQASGQYFATAYMKRFFPAAQQAKALLADLGPILSIHARSWQPWDLWNEPLGEAWLNHPSPCRRSYGGGVLVCAGSHILDLVHWFGGRARQVAGHLHVREGMDIDLETNALLWLESGAMAHVDFCWHPLRFAGYERNGWDERLEINTARGRLDFYTVTWNRPVNGALLVHQDAATGRTTEYRYPALNPFDLEMAAMLARFQAGEPGWPSAWDGYVVDATIAAITEASEREAVVPLTWCDRV